MYMENRKNIKFNLCELQGLGNNNSKTAVAMGVTIIIISKPKQVFITNKKMARESIIKENKLLMKSF